MKLLKCIYSLFLINLFFISCIYKASASTLESRLVVFSPEIKVEFSSRPCFGLLVTGRHIATSKECEQAISRQLIKESIKATNDQGEVLTLDDTKNIALYSLARLGSKMIIPISGGKAFNDSIFFKINSEEIFNSGLVYYMNEARNIVHEQISLNRENTKNNYKVISETLFPPGNPVFSENGEVLCFISKNNSCQIPDFNFTTNDHFYSSIYKRSSHEACRLKFLQCSDENFTTCLNNGNGEGTCTNERINEKCSIATYQNGFRASYQGQHLYCNNKDGCEVVICPSTCVGDSDSCSCTASYELNDLTQKSPCDCIDFTDTSLPCKNNNNSGNVSTALTYGLGFGIPVFVALVSTVVVLVVYYSRMKKRTDSFLYTRQL